ncbi:MAG: hypothetical protein ABIZ64_14795 [Casimicrobium sp.]
MKFTIPPSFNQPRKGIVAALLRLLKTDERVGRSSIVTFVRQGVINAHPQAPAMYPIAKLFGQPVLLRLAHHTDQRVAT